MTDKLSARRRSANMRRIRSENTTPELAVRRLVGELGHRYRVNVRSLPGKPDLVFPTKHQVIFVHGCFWHQHRRCADGRLPRSKRSYWRPKLQNNKARDTRNKRNLTRMGWQYLVLWECQIERGGRTLSNRIRRFLKHSTV